MALHARSTPSVPLPLSVVLLAALALGASASAQDAPLAPADAEQAQVAEAYAKIRDRALTGRRTFQLLRELCTTAPRRISGSPAAAAAVEWARQAMLAAGLEEVRLEPCTVPHWERGAPEVLRFAAPPEHAGEPLALLALGGSVATPPEGITAPVLVVRSVDDLRARAREARGKIVLFDRPLDPTIDPFQAYGQGVEHRYVAGPEAGKVGAVAALVRSMTPNLDDVPHTGGSAYEDGVPQVPVAAVSTLAAERIAGLVAAGQEVRLHLRLACKTFEDAPSFNVVGELRGRERPEEIVLVGGHLDAWDVGQGAHDDGAGCCQALEAVRLLKDLGLRPRRTLRVVFFMNEENGLRGARQYAATHADELPRHVFAVESDRGGFTPRGFTSDATPAGLELLRRIAGVLAPLGGADVRPGGGGADVGPLSPAGVPTAGYLPDPQRYFDLHHTEQDTLAAVSDRELEAGTVCIATLIWAVAEREETFPRNPPREASGE